MSRRPSMLKRFVMRFQRQAAFTQFLPVSRIDYGSMIGDPTLSSVVAAPLGWLCRTFPEAPLTFERMVDGAWESDDEHESLRLLRRPNSYYSGRLLWMATVASLYADGNAYWLKEQDGQMRTTALWWTPSNLLVPKWSQDGSTFITHYEYRPAGVPIRVEPSELVHFRYGIDPDNPRLGRSPLKALLREVYSDEEAANFTASLLRNMGVPGLVIAPDGDAIVEGDDLQAAKEKLEEHFTGDRRGKPLVAGAATRVQQFGFNPQQMDLRTLRRLPEERVTAALGVPAIVAGLGAGLDRSTFANMSEAREMAYETTIIPVQAIVAEDLTTQYLADFEPDTWKTRLRFDLSNVRVLQEDENKRTERLLKELTSGAITLSEYRRETGRESDGTHEVYLRPFSVVEVPVNGSAPAPEPPSTRGRGSARSGMKATAVQRELMQAFLAHEERLAGVFTGELVELFDGLGRAAERAYLEASALPKARKDATDDAILVARIMDRIDLDAEGVEALRPAFEKHYRVVTEDTVQTVNSITGLAVNLPDETMRRVVALGGTRAGLVDLTNSTRTALFRAIAAGREAGEGPDAVARRIRQDVPAGRFVNAGPQYRAKLIARTETKYAQNVSSMAAYRESPAVTGLLAFDAQGPGDSDADCMARDGQTFTFAEAEVELAEEHPNGTLSFAPVI